jgi:hypothetical protein
VPSSGSAWGSWDGIPGNCCERDAAVRHGLPDELARPVDEVERLLQVDDVDAVALSENALSENAPLHLRVPAPGLVAEVNAALQQLPHGGDRCHTSPLPARTRARTVRAFGWSAPARTPWQQWPRTEERARQGGPGRAPARTSRPAASRFPPSPPARPPCASGPAAWRFPSGYLTRAGAPDGKRTGGVPP